MERRRAVQEKQEAVDVREMKEAVERVKETVTVRKARRVRSETRV